MKKTQAMRLLDRKKIKYQLLEYSYDPENLDVQKIARDNDLDVRHVYKTLVLRGKETGLIVTVIPGDKQVDRKVIAKLSGNKKVDLLPVNELEKETGYIRGGCSPLGMKKNLPVFIDQSAEEWGRIWFNAGVRGILMQVQTDDLLQISQGELAKITMDF